MDRKSIIILIACGILLLTWNSLVNKIYPPIPAPAATNVVSTVTNVETGGTNQASVSAARTNFAQGSNVVTKFVANTNVPEQTLILSNANAVYVFTSRGGGLKEVQLLKYPETVSRRRQRGGQTNELATLHTPVSPPVLAILGDESLVSDGNFKLTQSNNVVRAEKALPSGLTLVKEFQSGTNYLLNAVVRLENHSKQPITIAPYSLFVGTATPMGPDDVKGLEGVMVFDGKDKEAVNINYFATNTTTFRVIPRTPKTEWNAKGTNIVWAAVQNQFFTLATMPQTPAHGIHVKPVWLPPPSAEVLKNHPSAQKAPRGLEAVMNYPGISLQPGQVVTQEFNLFTGPKEFQTLAYLSARFKNEIDLIMGFGGLTGPVAKTLLLIMNWLNHTLGLSYALAIIAITVTIKVIFWPLTQYSTKSAKRMQALQPQIKALQEKYKDEPQKISQKQMELFRKNGVNPLSGCFPMLIQIPVFFGFYSMLQSAIELRGAEFLWIGDLSKPDTIFYIPGLNFPVNPMPLIMGVTMLWQSHLTPPSPGMDPAQQKIMRYMPLIMLVFLYNFSSGLALYWTVQNLLTVLQTKLINAKSEPPAGATPAVATAPQKKSK